MSYILYIEQNLIDIDSQKVVITKQVNDIAKLSDRQANITSILGKDTANNRRAFDKLGLVGSNSNVPYIKLRAYLYDADTSEALTYDGWAIIRQYGKEYKITVYDGIIDFYKAIENKSLTQIGINDLNHLKNIPTVIDSFTNEALPYKYIVADYNGKSFHAGGLNIDYLVPSARYSYLWQRLHEYAGFTYEGSTFLTESFLNWFMTYPKPVPVNEPQTIPISSQQATIDEIPQTYSTGNGIFYGALYIGNLFPSNFDTELANNNNSYITIEQTGAFRITCNGTFTNDSGTSGIVNWFLRDSAGVLKSQGTIDGAINQTVVISAVVNDRLILGPNINGQNAPGYYNPLSGAMTTTIDLLLGFDANFDQVFLDFSAKDFLNEVLTHFGLTAIISKYRNHITYLTTDEIFQNPNVIDWSDKFVERIDVTPSIGDYAQKNLFKYKYNDENETHRNGAILVSDVNLKDETTVITSKMYAPEKNKVLFMGLATNVYKIWNKEVKDNGEVSYKDLSGRFYSLRAAQKPFNMLITSEALNTSQENTVVSFDNDYRLGWQQVIYDNYKAIGAIIDQAKFLECYFYLSARDVNEFDFTRLIYVDKLASYYQVNKIQNFTNSKVKTKVQLIEVDYFKEIPAEEIEQYINIVGQSLSGCTVTIDVETNIDQPAVIQIMPYILVMDGTGGLVWQQYPMNDIKYGTLENNQVVVINDFLPYNTLGYQIQIIYATSVFTFVTSNNSEVVMFPEGCYTPPIEPTDCSPEIVVISSVTRTNAGFPTPSDNGSLWNILYDLRGVDTSCVPYALRIEINSSLGFQSKTITGIISPPASMAVNFPLRPTTANVRVVYINPSGQEFPSPLFIYL